MAVGVVALHQGHLAPGHRVAALQAPVHAGQLGPRAPRAQGHLVGPADEGAVQGEEEGEVDGLTEGLQGGGGGGLEGR